MSEVIVRERYLKNGKKVYEYCFELAHEGGKRRRRTKSGFVIQALEENKTAAKPKPEQIIHKMVDGRIGKYYEEN